MLQVHDRVLNSRSTDTLLMLTVLAVGALMVYGVLEFIRALSFQAMGSALVRRLNLPVLTAAVQASVDQGLPKATQSLRDLTELRTFLTSSAVSAPLDAAWSPIFLARAIPDASRSFGIIGVVARDHPRLLRRGYRPSSPAACSRMQIRRTLKPSRKSVLRCVTLKRSRQWACCPLWQGGGGRANEFVGSA